MAEYTIEQYELHVMEHTVQARSLKEALRKVSEGDSDTGNFEYIQIPVERGANGIRKVIMPDGTELDGHAPADKVKINRAMGL